MPTAPPLAPNAYMRWHIVRGILAELAPATILEIGCGQGGFGARLARLARYTAVEPDPTSFSVARPRVEAAGGTALNVASDDLQADTTYDLVCAFEVLEHIMDDVGAVKSWRDLVAPGGHLLLSMPAWQERFNNWDSMVGHYRRYSPDEAASLLTSAGFRDPRVIVYGWPLGYALEAARSKVAGRRGATVEGGTPSMQERTAGSGRVLQPKSIIGKSLEIATLPFAAIQRLRPTRGTALVVIAGRDNAS